MPEDTRNRKYTNLYINEHDVTNFEVKLLDEVVFVSREATRRHEEHYRLMYEPPLNSNISTLEV